MKSLKWKVEWNWINILNKKEEKEEETLSSLVWHTKYTHKHTTNVVEIIQQNKNAKTKVRLKYKKKKQMMKNIKKMYP